LITAAILKTVKIRRYQTALTAVLILVGVLLLAGSAAADPVGMQQLGAGYSAKLASGFFAFSEGSNIKEIWNLTPQLRRGNDDMHARYYSSWQSRFLSVDPAPGDPKNPQSWNRSAYMLGDPIAFTDHFGEVVDMSELDPFMQNLLLVQLNRFTGNSYSLNAQCQLQLDEVGKDSSPMATDFLNDLMSPEAGTFWIGPSPNSLNYHEAGTTSVFLSFGSKDGMSSPDNIDTVTCNLGSTVIHELFHSSTGQDGAFGLLDGYEFPYNLPKNWRGPAVDFVNLIRSERGYFRRKRYVAKRIHKGWSGRKLKKTSWFMPGSPDASILIPMPW